MKRESQKELPDHGALFCPELDVFSVCIMLQLGLFLQCLPQDCSLSPERAALLEERGSLLPWMVSFKLLQSLSSLNSTKGRKNQLCTGTGGWSDKS